MGTCDPRKLQRCTLLNIRATRKRLLLTARVVLAELVLNPAVRELVAVAAAEQRLLEQAVEVLARESPPMPAERRSRVDMEVDRLLEEMERTPEEPGPETEPETEADPDLDEIDVPALLARVQREREAERARVARGRAVAR